MARIKYCNKQTGQWEYADNVLMSGSTSAVEYVKQKLTEEQKEQARENIEAAPASYGLNESNGNQISVVDSGNAPLHSLKLYGKTTQNGTPTPDDPVELESVGADGNVAVTVCGKNLISYPYDGAERGGTYTYNGITYTDNGDGSVTANGTATALSSFNFKAYAQAPLLCGMTLGKSYRLTGCPKGASKSSYSLSVCFRNGSTTLNGSRMYDVGDGITFDTSPFAEADRCQVVIMVEAGTTVNNVIFRPMLRLADFGDNTYEPYKEPQTLTAQTPNGLPGIPVSSGGNYTDKNGQQWVCDEIDFARGKYVQRVKTVSVDGSKDFSKSGAGASIFVFAFNDGLVTDVSYHSPYCSHYKYQAVVDGAKLNNNCFQIGVSSAPWNAMRFRDDRFSTVDAVKTHLSNNPFELQYILAEPIETDLAAEEIAQYSALHTNYPNTTVYNDEGAYMEVEYYSPISAVPMNMGSGRAGHIMTVDEHGCVNTAPKSSMPFAPAGYGLGENNGMFCTDANTATKIGFYWLGGEGTLNVPFYFAWGTLLVERRQTHIYQTAKSADGYPNQQIVTRYSTNSGATWSEWEWVNPPMIPGVEYRTTERFDRKAVYTQLVNCGIAAHNASITIPGVTRCVRYIGYISHPNESDPVKPLPAWSGDTIGAGYHAEVTQPVSPYANGKFIIRTDSNADSIGGGGYTWFVHAWYTKD